MQPEPLTPAAPPNHYYFLLINFLVFKLKSIKPARGWTIIFSSTDVSDRIFRKFIRLGSEGRGEEITIQYHLTKNEYCYTFKSL